MAHDDQVEALPRTLTYAWKHRGRWSRLHAALDGDAYLPGESSEEALITEHYWGYARQRDGSTLEYQVEHPRWRVWNARDAGLDADVAALYGPGFASSLQGRPTSCFVAEGSEILVRRGRPI